MALCDVHEGLGVQQLFAPLALGLHLQLELLLDFPIRRLEILNFEP